MNTNDQPERKSRITITVEPSLIKYAERIGRSNASLGFRHALLEYRDKLDPEAHVEEVLPHARADS
jgi:hypothetical protein